MTRQTAIPVAPRLGGARIRWFSFAWWLTVGVLVPWRYLVTGRPVLGGQDDNATWLHDATVDHRDRPVERLSRARWRRVARRWAFGAVPGGLVLTHYAGRATVWVCGVLEHPAPAWTGVPWLGVLLAYASAALLLAAVLVGRRVLAWWPTRHVVREYARPTWEVTARIIGEKYRPRDAARRVELPAGFGQESTTEEQAEAPELSVRIHLPVVPLDAGVKTRIATSAAERLGITQPVASWTVKGTRAFVDLTPRVFPPRVFSYGQARPHMLQADPRKPFAGMGPAGPVFADLDNDGPHIGVSGGTGTGKSTMLATVLSQRVRSGAFLVVCDYKVISHPWARRIAQEDPNRVRYAVDVPEISATILRVLEVFTYRRELLKTDPAALGAMRDLDLLVEEVNTLAGLLSAWWKETGRQEHADALGIGKADAPNVAPAFSALAALVQMGRELGIRVHFAAQRLDCSVLAPQGGGAIRESLSNRFLAKYTKQTWDMLCRGVPYEVFPGGPRGIWTAVVDGTVTHFRVPNLDRGPTGDAYSFAMSGDAPMVDGWTGATLPGTHRPAVVSAVKLSDALPQLPRFSTLDALRKAVARAGLEPISHEGRAGLYDLGALLALWGEEAPPELTR